MTLSEFKAWFEGFTEGMETAPDEKQWERIKERVKDINGTAVTYPVYVDRYVEPYRRYWSTSPTWGSFSSVTIPCSGGMPHAHTLKSCGSFNSHAAMAGLGKAEYKSMVS